MIYTFTPNPIKVTLQPEWNKSYLFARWVMDFHTELRELYTKYKKDCRKSGDDIFDFPQFCEFLYSNDRPLIEPHLN